jgi:RNA polymerase sigma-70 factor (ECF subfamily)
MVYRRSYAALFAFARRRLSSDHAADDAVSETMLRALKRIDTFSWQGAGFDAWLYGILRNVVSESHRDGRRAFSVADVPETRTTGDVSEALVRADDASEVRAAFAALTPDEQEILELRVVAGLSADEVAAVLGRRPGAIRMAQSRALARLRALYAGVTDVH